MKNKNKVLFILTAVIIVALITCLIVYKVKANEGYKNIVVQVEHLVGDKTEFKFKTKAEYLREALENMGLVQGSESTYGLWVETVDGETADESKEQWWGYTVNGEFAQYGVDDQVITDGDIYVFTLTEGY